nr:MAG TPA: RNA polymerase sigma factor [Caudoviricetes sp.]
MVLGNSNGKNKGKKYLRKNEIDIVFAKRADHFNEWFSKNYNTLIQALIDVDIFDEDIFHETYKNVYEKIFFYDIQGNNYRDYLMRAYYTNLILSKSKEGRFCELLPNTDKEDIDSDYFSELEEKRKDLEADIMSYIYSNYDIRDFELFKMYMSLKPAVNYSTLAKITGLKSHNIQRTISKIKKDIRDNKEFAKRRKEIL